MGPRKFYKFSYYTPAQKERRLLHQLRDGDAALELADVLTSKDYRYGGLVLNYPAEDKRQTRFVDDSFLRPGDLLLLTTRPPLDDEFDEPRSYISRSHTSLEDKVFAVLRNFFQRCSRSQVLLSDYVLDKSPRVAAWRNIEFKQNLTQNLKQNAKHNFTQNLGATYDSINRHKLHCSNLTAMYMLFVEQAWERGPSLLCAFGMGGPETLIWTYLLRTRFPDLVMSQEFVMAEMEAQPILPACDNLWEVNDWKVKILT